ncbi:hypothetical protein NDU88_005907 [Pleurodeles waltl]|uniref:Uncharacterized protein n=1 Tax=Pleurodeles waltl TaxID=8319 RepID=A0AAV7SN08_PLEWA|nr:hypothetical protein NDU88_005907 [Pleurodeles waltl]
MPVRPQKDKERYPGGALQSADVTSGDIIPEIKETTGSTERSTLSEEKEEEVAEPKEQERNRSASSTEQWTTETPTWASRAEPPSINDRTGTRADNPLCTVLYKQKEKENLKETI